MWGEGYGGHGDAVSRTLVDVVDKVHEAQLRWRANGCVAPRHRRALLVHRREDRDQPLWRLGVVLEVMLGHGVVREQQRRERRRGGEGGEGGGPEQPRDPQGHRGGHRRGLRG